MRLLRTIASVLAALCLTVPAHAVNITGMYTHIGAATWSAQFSVTNEAVPLAIDEFTIYFSPARFADLGLSATPGGWDALVAQPDPALMSDGFLDAVLLTPTSAIGAGGTQAGFAVQFTYLDPGTPKDIRFDIYNADFQLLSSGQVGSATTPVPEPPFYVLLGLGLGVLTLSSQRRRRSPANGADASTGVLNA